MEIYVNILDPASIKDAKKKLGTYKRKINYRTEKLVKMLVEFGANYARDYFDGADYDVGYYYGMESLEDTVISISVEGGNQDDKTIRYTVNANGEAIAFIEFGAGVYFNGGGDPYHETRPEGIVGIGEYGQHRGRQQSWFYKSADGESKRTRGTPEQPGMWRAAQEVRQRIESMAKEVFSK